MQTIPDLQTGGPASPTPAPGKVSSSLRGAGRLLARLFGLAIVAAAGVAGWFAVEQFVFPQLPGSVAAAVNETPWPDEYAEPTTEWNAFTVTYTFEGNATHRTSFDPQTKRSRLTYWNTEGAIINDVELAGLQAFQRFPELQEWTPVDPERVDTHVQLGILAVEPVHLSALVPAEVYPFTRVSELAPVDGARQFEVIVDAAGFLDADPISFYRWDATARLGSDAAADMRWIVDVRPDGYVVRWEGRSPSVETWTEYPADLVFESPLAPVSPTAGDSSAPMPDESAPPVTVEG